jgi:sugar O-acyltransferase (sialic acid O-acetyltransferase NeuD family)
VTDPNGAAEEIGIAGQEGRVAGIPRIVIYGASGHALAVGLNGRHRLLPRPLYEVVAYIDDFRGGLGHALDGAPVISFDQWREEFVNYDCLIAVGDPKSRRRLAERIGACGGRFARLYDRNDISFPHASVGAGSVVAATSDIGPQTTLGEHVIVMPMSWVAHDVRIGDCVSLGASCSIAGHVVIEDDVFVGAGTTIVHGQAAKPLIIGAGAKIAAGAVVTKSVPTKTSVAGNPSRALRDIVRERLTRSDPA